jgi:hypothetical protein
MMKQNGVDSSRAASQPIPQFYASSKSDVAHLTKDLNSETDIFPFQWNIMKQPRSNGIWIPYSTPLNPIEPHSIIEPN